MLDKRTLKREGIKRRKICQTNIFKDSGEKERKKFSLSIDWMMISPKVAKHLLPSPALWRARPSLQWIVYLYLPQLLWCSWGQDCFIIVPWFLAQCQTCSTTSINICFCIFSFLYVESRIFSYCAVQESFSRSCIRLESQSIFTFASSSDLIW